MKDKNVLMVSYIGWAFAFLLLCVGVFLDIRKDDWVSAVCNVVWMGIVVLSVFSTKEYKKTLDEKNKYRQDAFDLASENYKLRGEAASLKQSLENAEIVLEGRAKDGMTLELMENTMIEVFYDAGQKTVIHNVEHIKIKTIQQ